MRTNRINDLYENVRHLPEPKRVEGMTNEFYYPFEIAQVGQTMEGSRGPFDTGHRVLMYVAGFKFDPNTGAPIIFLSNFRDFNVSTVGPISSRGKPLEHLAAYETIMKLDR